jgi:hypothetical protein
MEEVLVNAGDITQEDYIFMSTILQTLDHTTYACKFTTGASRYLVFLL